MKTGRNAPCPCGSGKKYKSCCGRLDTARPMTHVKGELNIPWAMSHAWKEYQSGKYNVSIKIYRDILCQQPMYADAHHHLAIALSRVGDFVGAIASMEKAIKINPKNAYFYNALGFIYAEIRNPFKAIESLNKALAIMPGFALAYLNRAKAYIDAQMVDAGIADYKRAIAIQSDLSVASQNMLYALNFSCDYSCVEVSRQHMRFGSQYAESFAEGNKTVCARPASRKRLRVGYVSADFRRHSVAYFIEPILENHDHDYFEVFAYYNNSLFDSVTYRLKQCCDQWFNIMNLSDDALEELIRQHEIDILIDLSGHTANSRVLVFARKPAPIQLSWIGYPNTTGLPTIDYRIGDRYTDPPGESEHLYCESLIRMDDCFLCYKPAMESPEVACMPAANNGYVTFGSFNNLAKITAEVLHVWSEIIRSVPDSRLVLKSRIFKENESRKRLLGRLSDAGIDLSKVTMLGWNESLKGHLESYSKIDIGLDTFPYNGTTTTCEALWMGVPVITFSGECHRSRVGTSLLKNLGIGELIAKNEQEYIKLASELAVDYYRLSSYRTSLREQMLSSGLTNGPLFTKQLENIYRSIWDERFKSAS